MIRSLVSTIILAVFLVGCGGDGIGPESGTRVTIAFTAGSSAAQTSGAQAASSMVAASGGDPVMGVKGTLTLTDVWMIVAEFELEKVSGTCGLGEGLECHDFEAAPSFLKLPLDGGVVTVATSDVPLGTYDELEFEVEDLEDDPEDEHFAEIEALRSTIQGEFPDWPDKASMLVVGTFMPAGGEAMDFRVYFDAEIEIELDLVPSLVVTEDGASRTLTVDVQPDMWFMLPDNNVMDLTQYDWGDTGQLLEFDVELEHGFIDIEIG